MATHPLLLALAICGAALVSACGGDNEVDPGGTGGSAAVTSASQSSATSASSGGAAGVTFDTVVCAEAPQGDQCGAPVSGATVTVEDSPPKVQTSNQDGYDVWTVADTLLDTRITIDAPGFDHFDSGTVHPVDLAKQHNVFQLQPTQVPPPDGEAALGSASVLNSPGDIASWPATATITLLDLQATGVHIDFTKKDGPDSWPDVPFGAPGDSLEYTLWILIDIDGAWYASGCIEYWRGLYENGGPPSQYAMNWYYDPIRWGDMVGHQPAVGEWVGFFVSAGDARNNGNSIVQERSNVVVVPFPADTGATFTF